MNEMLDWDSAIDAVESEFIILPAGVYPFQITNMERKIYDGQSEHIPNGTKFVEITLKIASEKGDVSVKDSIFMLKKWQWKLTQFFSGIGQNVVIGQPFQPNWQTVVGSFGTVEIEVNKYKNREGNERENNRVKKYVTQTQQQPTPQQMQQQPTQTMQQQYTQPMQQQAPMQSNWQM